MVKDIIVIYSKNETIFYFNQFETFFFCILKNQYLTQVFLNFKEALLFQALVYNANEFEYIRKILTSMINNALNKP